MVRRKLLSLTAFLLFCQYGVYTNSLASTLVSAPDGDYVERESETVPIAGAFVTSVVAVGEETATIKPSITAAVRTPGTWKGEFVCLRGQSRDGKYESSRNHLIPESIESGDLIEFKYPTKTPRSAERIKSADSSVFGLTITLGRCDHDKPVYLAPFLNTKVTSKINQIKVAINSVGADAAWMFVGDSPDAPAIDCQQVAESNKRGFDFFCMIDLHSDENDGSIKLEINTESNNVIDPPVSIVIKTPF